MEWKLLEMLEMQAKVNDMVGKKLENTPTPIQYILAMHVEVFEFINACGTWKWWKHSHVPNKEKILDELADVMAFFFSYLLTFDNDKLKIGIDAMKDIYEELNGYDNNALLQFITESINDGQQLNPLVFMVISVIIAGNTVQANWSEIEQAYYKKSNINIQRQIDNY